MKIFDTLTKSKVSLIPENKKIRIFVCGPTLYDNCHIGHARVFVLVDLIIRLLESRNYIPHVIVNVTDIDPKLSKIENNNINPDFLLKDFIDDLNKLGISDMIYAKTSDYVKEAKNLIGILIKRKFAYSVNGNVYLDTSKFKTYGVLSHLSKKELSARRYDIDINKRNITDIFLWNTSDNYGTQFNDKILGDGTPWWHMQDTAVAMFHFNGNYDMHVGGTDLSYPHHEVQLSNLMALSQKEKPVKCWVHVGILDIENEKMSKSSGNAIYIRELLKKYDMNTLKLYFYSHNYKKLINFNFSELMRFERINNLIRNLVLTSNYENENYDTANENVDYAKESDTIKQFRNYIEDDLDTPNALKLFLETVMHPDKMNDAVKMMKIFGLRY
ncbi:MAG TPA: class I tRNA ligase family protein [Nitrososphaeraceae archaeon]|nr:class I tRNA ligase family protein [Nitrososphaeraceae archaeon]